MTMKCLKLSCQLALVLFNIIYINGSTFGQELKSNPIIFLDLYVGPSLGYTGGLTGGGSINYQKGGSLFTIRSLSTVRMKIISASPWFPLPVPVTESNYYESGILYGRRFIKPDHAYSFSGGIASGKFRRNVYKDNNYEGTTISRYFTFPFEGNIKWFKKEKRPYRLMGLVPVGPPTGLGKSIGFKIFGNISEQPFIGLGIAAGLGFHKIYQ